MDKYKYRFNIRKLANVEISQEHKKFIVYAMNRINNRLIFKKLIEILQEKSYNINIKNLETLFVDLLVDLIERNKEIVINELEKDAQNKKTNQEGLLNYTIKNDFFLNHKEPIITIQIKGQK